jgi:hypothetical protein
MKKIFNKILIAIAFMALVSSCQKDDLALNNPFVDINNLGKGAYVTLNSTTNVNLNSNSPDASTVGVKIDPYDNGVKIKEVKLYVYKGSSADPKAWKFIKTIPVAGTTTIAATGAEIAKAYGIPSADLFKAGQSFTFYHQVVTEDGKTYDISNTVGALESASGYNACMRWTAYVVCPYTSSMAGTYKVLSDTWEDSYPGDIVQITDGPTPNTLNMSAVWPGQSAAIVNPLIITINPVTGAVSLPSAGITFEKYASGTTYLAKNASGYAFACTGSITFRAQLFANGTSDVGYWSFSLQKQ